MRPRAPAPTVEGACGVRARRAAGSAERGWRWLGCHAVPGDGTTRLAALALVGAVALVSGCGRWQVTSSHRPPASALLELPAPRTQPRAPAAAIATRPAAAATRPAAAGTRPTTAGPVASGTAKRQASGTAARATRTNRPPVPEVVTAPLPPETSAARVAVVRALEKLVGQTTLEGRPASDLALVRASFAPLGGPAAAADGLDGLYRGTAPRGGAIAPGDLLFFEAVAEVPAVCVVRRRLPGGALEAGCVTRKAVRWVRLDLQRPNARREGGEVVNTFLRPRRRSDPPRARYLAGQLLREVRSAISAEPRADAAPAQVAAGR